ncbi:MAG: tetratricopeptide repeat protein [Gemmataceae bacterium]|nr:tetratricopeptide repeat protein [Gemmataceae bacterium]
MTAKTRIEQIAAMIADDPDDPELRYMLAMEYASAGNDEEAVHCFRELLAHIPDYPPAYHMGGRTLQRLGRTDEARELLKAGIAVALRRGDAHTAGEMQEFLDNLD